MSIVRLCVILGFIVTSYGVRRFLEEVEVALLESGYTQRIVAEHFDVSRSVVARLWRHYQETGEFTRRVGQGQHRMMSQREDQYLRNLALRNRQYMARRLQINFQHAIGQRISDQTIRNRLHVGDLRARRLARGPILTRQHCARWYEFAQEHQNWRLQNWRIVLFTDESRFHRSACDRRVRVPRRCQECCAARGGHTHYWQEKGTDLHMSMTFEIIWRKDGDFSNIYANSSSTGYRPWFVNRLPMFAINMLQIKLFIFLNRCFIIIIQHLYTMRKYVFAPLIVLSSVFTSSLTEE